jgi:hypothetical protein
MHARYSNHPRFTAPLCAPHAPIMRHLHPCCLFNQNVSANQVRTETGSALSCKCCSALRQCASHEKEALKLAAEVHVTHLRPYHTFGKVPERKPHDSRIHSPGLLSLGRRIITFVDSEMLNFASPCGPQKSGKYLPYHKVLILRPASIRERGRCHLMQTRAT